MLGPEKTKCTLRPRGNHVPEPVCETIRKVAHAKSLDPAIQNKIRAFIPQCENCHTPVYAGKTSTRCCSLCWQDVAPYCWM